MKKERLLGPDILRAIAICLVMATHALNYRSSYLQTDLRSPIWTAAVFVRFTVVLCVPLFLLLSGYLLAFRKPNRRHFTSIITVMLSWLVLTVIVNLLEWNLFAPTAVSLPRAILNIFNFNYGYTWYVEMYLCLFLVIPYINAALENLSRRANLAFVAVVCALTLLPAVGKSFIVTGIWFNAFPEQFENMYCLAYYLIGAYIARYKPCPSRILCICIFFGTIAAETVLCYFSSSTEYAWWLFYPYSAATHAIAATALFLLLYGVKKLPRPFAFVIREISVCSFEMYLIFCFTDRLFYSPESLSVTIPALSRLTSVSFALAIVSNFLCTYILARISRLLLVPLSNVLRRIAQGKPRELTSDQ